MSRLAALVLGAVLAAAGTARAQPTDARAIPDLQREVWTLRSQGRFAEAIATAERLVELAERAPPNATAGASLGPGLLALAQTYADAGRVDDADAAYRRAIAIFEARPPGNTNLLALALGGRCRQESALGLVADAQRSCERALALWSGSSDTDARGRAALQSELGALYAGGATPERAEPLLRAAHETLVAEGRGVSVESARLFRSMARSQRHAKDPSLAARRYEYAIDIAVRAEGEDAPFAADLRRELAAFWVEAGQPDRGAAPARRALAVLERPSAATPPLRLASALGTMAAIQMAQGDLDSAFATAVRASDIAARLPAGESQRVMPANDRLLAEIEARRGHAAEAARLQARGDAARDEQLARAARVAVVHPRFLPANGPRPSYPAEARRHGFEGRTVVRAMVDANGIVTFARVAESSGHRSLDEAAVQAVVARRLDPARDVGGLPVDDELLVPIAFVLETPGRSAATPSQRPPTYDERVADAIRAQLVPLAPEVLRGRPDAVVMVSMKSDGTVTGRVLRQASGVPQWDAAVLAAIDRTPRLPVDSDGFAPVSMALHLTPRP